MALSVGTSPNIKRRAQKYDSAFAELNVRLRVLPISMLYAKVFVVFSQAVAAHTVHAVPIYRCTQTKTKSLLSVSVNGQFC